MARRVMLCGALLVLAALVSSEPLRLAKLKYGGGGDWYANPSSLPNLLKAVAERTTIPVVPKDDVVTPLSPDLYRYPILNITGHGNIRFTPEEAAHLRDYLLHGGFLHVDDNYGLDDSFRKAVKVLFPDRDLVELPYSHEIYHCFYDFPTGLPKIHEHHGGPPHGYGILYQGRVVLFYSFNTDLSDGWESPEVHHDPPEAREAALRMGVNIVVYALSH